MGMQLGQPVLSLIAYLLLAVEGGIVSVLIPILIAPRTRGLLKEDRFECGQTPPPYGRRRLAMQYYPFILVFLVFDVIVFLLFLWVYVSKMYFASLLPFALVLFLLIPPVLLVRKLSEDIKQWW